MSQQAINLGTAANDGTGDTLRVAGAKVNADITALYAAAITPDSGWTANGDHGSKAFALPANINPSAYADSIAALDGVATGAGSLLFIAIERIKSLENAVASLKNPTY